MSDANIAAIVCGCLSFALSVFAWIMATISVHKGTVTYDLYPEKEFTLSNKELESITYQSNNRSIYR